MSHTIQISSELFKRIQSFAEPLIDTLETVMDRALDALALQGGQSKQVGPRVYNGAVAPNLSFTTVRSVIVGDKKLPAADTYWNNLLRELLRQASKTLTTEKLSQTLPCNHVTGQKDENGYNFIPEAGLSVQAAEANKAWKAAYAIAAASKIPVEVEFDWQDNPKAANPNQSAKFSLKWE
jgi:hypothetical protein